MSIRIKLTITFMAIALLPLCLVSAITFNNYKNYLESDRLSDLQNIAAYKADIIEKHFADLRIYFELGQVAYVIKKNLPVMTQLASDPANPEFIAARKMVDAVYHNLPSSLGLRDIMLTDPQGKIVYSNNSEHFSKEFLNFLPDPQQKAFKEGKDKIYYSDIFFNKTHNDKPSMLITGPARDFSGNFIGVIAAEVDMAPVYKLIQDTAGMGNTGETLVGKKTGNQVVYLNPLRHDPDAALKRRIDIGGEIGRPIQEAVQGKTGAGQYHDYRGKEVIGAWRYIPALDWGIVAKIDQQEAFADVTNLRNLIIIILVIIFVLVGIIALSIAQSISQPVKRLSEGAAIIGSGNLDYKVTTNLKDEVGQLSRSFDKMVQDLKTTTASRDELNREIIERKRIEEELRRQRELLAVTLASIGDAVIVTDIEGHVTFINGEAERLTGWTNQEAMGQPLVSVFNIINEQTRQPVESPVDKVLRLGIVVGLANHTVLIAKDGRQIPIDDSGAPIKQADGTVHGVVLVFRDFTEQKKAENEIQQHIEELLRFNRAMAGRELRMIELKKEINDLCDRLGQEKRYILDFDKEQP